MTIKKTTDTARLWSFQSLKILELLASKDLIFASWSFSSSSTEQAYGLIKPLIHKPSFENCKMPFWCWYFQNKHCELDVREAGLSLLSCAELKEGIVLLEMNVPFSYVEFLSYDSWNEFIDGKFSSSLKDLFIRNFDLASGTPAGLVQAIIPFIDIEWVVDVSPFH